MTDYQVKRNYRGQVFVMPPGEEPLEGEWVTSKDYKRYFRPGGRSVNHGVWAYSRTSSAGENLKGGGDGLANWKACMAALGTVMSDSARSQVATLINEYDGDPYYKGDEDGVYRSGKSRLLEAVNLACEVAGSSTASSRGTEFHKLGELINSGQQPRVVQPHLKEHLKHYRERVAPIKFLAQESLIVNDILQRAGSLDYLLRLPAGVRAPDGEEPKVVVGDLKTGRWDIDYPAGVSAQLAGYGLGYLYDQETNQRSVLHPDCSRKWAVIVHYPIVKPDARVEFYWVDMEMGLKAAQFNNELDRMIKFYKSSKGRPVHFDFEG